MPNHVSNVLEMEGITTLPIFERDEKGNPTELDFNTLIPMPEELNVTDDGIHLLRMEIVLRKLYKNLINYKNTEFMGQFHLKHMTGAPNLMTDEVYNEMIGKYHFRENDEKFESDIETLKRGLGLLQNMVLHNGFTWYDWRVKHWGTKWNAYHLYIRDADTISFNTAWGAPHPFIDKLASLYPDKLIEHYWADEQGGGVNAGHIIYQHGKPDGEYDTPGSNEGYEHFAYCWGWDCRELNEEEEDDGNNDE